VQAGYRSPDDLALLNSPDRGSDVETMAAFRTLS